MSESMADRVIKALQDRLNFLEADITKQKAVAAAEAFRPTDAEMKHFRESAEAKEIPFNAIPPDARTKMNRVSKPGSESLLKEVMR